MHYNKQFKCNLCRAQMKDKDILQNQIFVQHEGKITACKFCNKMFKWRSSPKNNYKNADLNKTNTCLYSFAAANTYETKLTILFYSDLLI